MVREDVAVRRHEETGALRAPQAQPDGPTLHLHALDALRLNQHYGRLHVLRDARERVAQVGNRAP